MHVVSLGYVKVPTAGVQVNLGPILTALNLASEVLENGKCHHIEFWPLLANTGVSYVGLSPTARASGGANINRATGVNVIKQVQIPQTTGHQDFARVDGDGQTNSLLVSDFAVDVAVNGEGFAIFLVVM